MAGHRSDERTAQQDRAGDVWIGTSAGISRWFNGRLVTARMPEGLAGRLNAALIDDSDGQMWLGANFGSPLLRFTRRDFDAASSDRGRELQFSLCDTSDGLQGSTHWVSRPANARDRGRLWFATGTGGRR